MWGGLTLTFKKNPSNSIPYDWVYEFLITVFIAKLVPGQYWILNKYLEWTNEFNKP